MEFTEKRKLAYLNVLKTYMGEKKTNRAPRSLSQLCYSGRLYYRQHFINALYNLNIVFKPIENGGSATPNLMYKDKINLNTIGLITDEMQRIENGDTATVEHTDRKMADLINTESVKTLKNASVEEILAELKIRGYEGDLRRLEEIKF